MYVNSLLFFSIGLFMGVLIGIISGWWVTRKFHMKELEEITILVNEIKRRLKEKEAEKQE